MNTSFHEKLKDKIDTYVHLVYDYSDNFPQPERFGAQSQLREAAMSVMLNYIEGYARQKSSKDRVNFLKTSYGSLKESRYLVQFSHQRGWMDTEAGNELLSKSDRIGKMLWGTIDNHDE